MSDPTTPPADDVTGDDLPAADALEQAQPADQQVGAPSDPGALPDEADPADVVEQHQSVPLDEDDYR
ncbi:hypothetical protein EV189_2638 [Motilibacter rhizosphaerae]|uniref:Uncharacterized protein n=1 Tax=Motilibacter rhizosphaerae TaxID=598652 RepID=A0A4Q7NPI5_9ACTN|nr:hypothetical protein [Motilibacter rhizosphaerae]RZS87214.1 hypothetical protein EV189_2638 [Motilibacter rhizosphaerae]